MLKDWTNANYKVGSRFCDKYSLFTGKFLGSLYSEFLNFEMGTMKWADRFLATSVLLLCIRSLKSKGTGSSGLNTMHPCLCQKGADGLVKVAHFAGNSKTVQWKQAKKYSTAKL